jgi:hypothetical protein
MSQYTPEQVDLRNLIYADLQFEHRGETDLKWEEIQALVERGWMHEGQNNDEFDLTDEGRTVLADALSQLQQGEQRAVIDGKYDNVLVPFARLMAKELHANAGKGDRPGWLSMTPATGMLEIYYHTAKLQKAVKGGNCDGIREFAADVANMAMMLLDACGGLAVDERMDRAGSFQERVSEWMEQCFLPSLYSNMTERGDRLLEEVLELLQSKGYDRTRVATLVDYVWGRPVGEPAQEVGGVMVTLAGFCWIAGLDMHAAGDAELARINAPEVMEKIRRKQEAKNALHFDTPLPGQVKVLGAA